MVESNIDAMPCEFLGADFQSGFLHSGAVDFTLQAVQTPGIQFRKSFEYADLIRISKKESTPLVSLQQELSGMIN